MRILMIHGRAQGGKSEQELASTWEHTLRKGYLDAGIVFPEGVAIDLPFYGNKLDEITAQFDLPSTDSVVAKGPSEKNREFEQFLQQTLNEMRQKKQISDAVDLEIEETNAKEKGVQNWGITQAIVRVIDRYLTGVSDFTIELFLRDVFLYVNHPNITDAINNIVADKITDEPTLVVGHSLGSVVAYKMLTDPKYQLNLKGFITIGSPLGISAVSSKLGRVRNPAAGVGWFNAYDERDIVALNPLNDKYFPVDPHIVNDNTISNHTENRHGIVGYLDDVKIVREISGKLS